MKKIQLILFVLISTTIGVPLLAQDIMPASKAGKWGYIDSYGNVVVPFIFDDAESFVHDNRAKVKIKNKWGYINRGGDIVIPCQYQKISEIEAGMTVVKSNNKWGVIDINGKIKIALHLDTIYPQYSWTEDYYGKLIVGKANGEFKAYYNNKLIVKPASYDSLAVGNDGYIIAYKDKQFGLLDTLGGIALPLQYDEIESLYSYSFGLKSLGKTSYFDTEKKKVQTLDEYYASSSYRYGCKPTSRGNCDIYVNSKGENVFNKRFHTARSFGGGIAMVTDFDLSRHCIDTLGNVLFDVPSGIIVGVFDKGFALIKEEATGNRGLINSKGKIILDPAAYEDIYMTGSFFRLTRDDLISFCDTLGNVVSLQYSTVEEGGGIMAYVERDGKWGYVDEAYREVVTAVYDSCITASYELGGVRLNGKWGYIDKLGNTVIPFIFDEVTPFLKGLALVKYKGKYGIIDEKNRARVKFEYDKIVIDRWAHIHELRALEYFQPDRMYFSRSGR